MPLHYETSSIQYDDIDLIHGKFVAAKDGITSEKSVRIFCNVYGVFGDLTGRFASKYDNLVIPCRMDCILDPDYIRNHVSKAALATILEEEFFWKNMSAFPWYMLLMGEIYKLCKGDYYLMISYYDSLQLEDRVVWIWRHFGHVSQERTFIAASSSWSNLVRGRNDILIDSNLVHIEKWGAAGGSGFWWPEMSIDCKDPSKILSKRIGLLNHAVRDLVDLVK